MTVNELREILDDCPDNMEIHVKWLNSISSLSVAAKKQLKRDKHSRGECDNVEGKIEVLLISPFDIRIGSRSY